jgi:hypothetical protein
MAAVGKIRRRLAGWNGTWQDRVAVGRIGLWLVGGDASPVSAAAPSAREVFVNWPISQQKEDESVYAYDAEYGSCWEDREAARRNRRRLTGWGCG